MTKQEKALEVIERLRKEYPDAGCTVYRCQSKCSC